MKILLAVTGGIAAYKACSLTSVLDTLGHEIQCVMTDKAQEFISAMSLAALSHRPVLTNEDEWSCADGKIPHIFYTQEWADVFIIVPATANTMTKIALGLADDIVSCMALAAPEELPKLICPAMNTVMWDKVRNDESIKAGLSRKIWCQTSTVSKKLACGATGYGGLLGTKEIVEAIGELPESYKWLLKAKNG